ncbi:MULTISPECIES: NADPH:quinone oxidoreductase family protein [Prauserella salsuginis group]|uniref:NADPH:quinone oxidoreductase family protein n=1 Tax=Prauserella salsuginis TaxID=387889 RepID=A0ABW6FY17_9PSEU|nr:MULTISPECIES: NADPH:quinone oxidoreductase family protein [Prauserella salsuginis group]MCR3720134.1 NADPH2:quinone reductase [Prauserella flava]MCR3734157.1 NADPH2:quinone reductase [Prauserella salsuginis]
MRAIHISSLDGPSAVEVVDVPAPADEEQVTVDVRAAGVAFPELLQTRGLYQVKPELPFVPGAEVAGVVAAAPASSGLAVGDRVASLPLLGGFADRVLASPDLTFRLPDGVSFEEGASFLFNYCTSYFALLERGHLAEGETVLVHGGAGGIGTSAIQVAKAFGAGRVIAVVSASEKGDVAMAAGADEFVLAENFKDEVGRAVDVVLDPVGGDRFTDSLRTLREHGRLLVVGFAAGDIPTVKVNRLLLNNISVTGVGWGAYSMPRPGHVATQWAAMEPHLRSGALKPVLGPSFPLEQAADALQCLERRAATGKVVLTV